MAKITVFSRTDLTKQGMFKKKHKAKIMSESDFIQDVIAKNLSVSKGYVDTTGYLNGDTMFKADIDFNGKKMMVGVSDVIKKIEQMRGNKQKTKIVDNISGY